MSAVRFRPWPPSNNLCRETTVRHPSRRLRAFPFFCSVTSRHGRVSRGWCVAPEGETRPDPLLPEFKKSHGPPRSDGSLTLLSLDKVFAWCQEHNGTAETGVFTPPLYQLRYLALITNVGGTERRVLYRARRSVRQGKWPHQATETSGVWDERVPGSG